MAKIQINYAGRVAPATQTGRVPADAFITPDSGGAQQLQRTGERIMEAQQSEEKERQRYVLAKSDQLEREARAEAKHNEERARRNRMASTYAQYQVDVETAADEISAGLTDGRLKRDDAPKALADRLATIRKTHIEPLDQTSQAELSDNLILFDNRANRTLGKAVQQHAKQERIGTFSQLTESLQRLAVTDPNGAISRARNAFMGTAEQPGEGVQLLGADAATKQFQQFQEHAFATHFTERLNRTRTDARGLQALERDVSGNAALDPDKKNILLGRIAGFRETLAARAERAEQSRLRTVEHQIKALDSLILSGFEPNAQQFTAIQSAAKGTPYEPVVKEQIAFANQSTQFRAMAPRGQEAFLNDFERQVRANPTPDGTKTLEKYRSIFNAQREAVRADPISFAAQKGLADVAPLDFSKPDTLSDQLMARANVSRGMQAQYGSPLKVLTTEEATTLGRLMREGSVEQKRQLLGYLATGLRDREAYNATMSQIAPDDPVTAYAGVLAQRGLKTNRERFLSDLVLRGQALMRPDTTADGKPTGGKLMVMPAEELLARPFNNAAGDAFAGRDQARNTFYQSAKAVYAALSSDEGDFSGELKSSRWQTAINLATGGFTKQGGRIVVLPQGYETGQFRNELKSRTEVIAQSGRLDNISAATLRSMPMENIGDGRYVFRSGDGVLVDKKGQRVVVDFNEPLR